MNIGIDIDGVIADIEPYVFEYGSKSLYDKGRSLENIDKEKYETYQIFNWDRDDEHEFWDKYMLDYYTNAPTRIFASEAAIELARIGMRIGGGKAYNKAGNMERLLRDSYAGQIMAPSVDVLTIWLGRAITGQPLV